MYVTFRSSATQLLCNASSQGHRALSSTADDDHRFEKSLYDLIRGLRNNKGNEKEYIQNSLKECRAEVRSQDIG